MNDDTAAMGRAGGALGWCLVVAVVGLALGGSPAAAGHGKTPAIAISPNCGPAGTTLRINVEGSRFAATFSEGEGQVELLFEGRLERRVPLRDDGSFPSTEITPAARSAGVYGIAARDPSDGHIAVRPFRVPCPTLQLTPACDAAGTAKQTWSIHARGFNFSPNIGQEFPPEVRLLFAEEAFGPFSVDSKGNFQGTITPRRRSSGTYPVTAVDDNGFEGRASFGVPCPPSPTSTGPPPTPAGPSVGTPVGTGPDSVTSDPGSEPPGAQPTQPAEDEPPARSPLDRRPGGRAPASVSAEERQQRQGEAGGAGAPGAKPPEPASSGESAPQRPSPAREVAVDRPGGPPGRSSFPDALSDATEVSFEPPRVALNLALAVLLVLLIGFPAELFNKTLEENYDEVRHWFARRTSTMRRLPRLPAAVTFPAFAVVATVLYGLLDPNFGANAATVALLVGLLVAIGVTTLAFEFPIGLYTRAVCRERPFLRTFPGALLMAAGCVVVSRLANFQPGYAYGIFAGYALVEGRNISSKHHGRSVAIASLCVLVLSLGAWLAWIPVNEAASHDRGLPVLVADAVLAAVFVLGLEGLVFALAPLRFLDGKKLIEWSRPLWLVIYGTAVFGFVHIVLNPGTGYLRNSDYASLAGALVLFLIFGVVSVAFWAYFRYRGASVEETPV